MLIFYFKLYFHCSKSDVITLSWKVITLLFNASTIFESCVAIIIVFQSTLRSVKIHIISFAVSGSKLPVGSSQIIIFGSWTNALAIATLCFSPQLSS